MGVRGKGREDRKKKINCEVRELIGGVLMGKMGEGERL